MIAGPEGFLETRYHSISGKRMAPVVLICPPHPEWEGTMDHRVIYSLYRSFSALGFNVLRFNFRGAGRSQGVFSNGEEEIMDAAACLDWLASQNALCSQCWVAGFSFGAWIGMQLLMRRPECHRFVIVAPPTNLYDFSFLAPCPAPGLIVHGGVDEITPKDSVVRFAHHLSLQRKGQKIDMKILEKVDHAFSSGVVDLEQVVSDYIRLALQGETISQFKSNPGRPS